MPISYGFYLVFNLDMKYGLQESSKKTSKTTEEKRIIKGLLEYQSNKQYLSFGLLRSNTSSSACMTQTKRTSKFKAEKHIIKALLEY